MLLLIWHNRLSRDAHQYQTITGKGYRPRIIDLRHWRYVTAAIMVVIFALAILMPMAILVFTSLQPFYEGVTWDSFERFTLENFSVVLGLGSFHDAIVNTLVL